MRLDKRLAERTLELVDIPSESGAEEAIREHLISLVSTSLPLVDARDEAFLFAPAGAGDVPLVLLVGHYDTIPAQGNLPGRIEDGVVHGLGASDMKGGLAVAVELIRDLDGVPAASVDVGLVLFGREELPYEHDPLPALLDGSSLARGAMLAIVLEPTDGVVQAGCLGNVIARVTFHGRSGHSARPWDADNAIAHAVHGLAPLLVREPREAEVEGLAFREVISITRLEAGIADNVIPGTATATVNLRYAPDRTPAEAEDLLRSLAPDGATLEIESHAPAGAVSADSTLVRALVQAGAREVLPKQAWTNVADFTARGVEAVNFGPGHTRFAHRQDEQVEVAALVRAYETLKWFLANPMILEDSR